MKLVKFLGPGLITAALVFGPGSLTVTSRLGASFGFDLLWVIPPAVVLMMGFTVMSTKIGVASSRSLLQLFRDKWGDWAAIACGFALFFVTASFQAGNTIGAGIAFSESFQTPTWPWISIVSLAAISLLFFKSFYKILERVMMLMVAVMLVSFLFTLILSQPEWGKVIGGLTPSIPDGALLLVVALVASSFSIGGAFYQSYLVQEKGWKVKETSSAIMEGLSGILVLGIITGTILMSAAAILQPKNIAVQSAGDMGNTLAPLYGNWAGLVFMLGLFGASFSSLVGNATIGGTLCSDALNQGRSLNSLPVKLFISLIIIIGALVALVFGKLPLELIVFAQGITIFAVPFIGIGIMMISNDRSIMGASVNGLILNTLGIIGIGVLFFLAGTNFYQLFLK